MAHGPGRQGLRRRDRHGEADRRCHRLRRAVLREGQRSGVAGIKNPPGTFVQPDADSVAAALAEATTPTDLKILPNYKPTDADAYPISTPTWALVFAKPADAAKGKLLKAFLAYAVGPGSSRPRPVLRAAADGLAGQGQGGRGIDPA